MDPIENVWDILNYEIYLEQKFPTWGTCTPRGTFAYPKEYIWG